MTLKPFQTLLQSVEPSVYLVETRVLRRVIRLDRQFQGFRVLVPHYFSYVIDRERLLSFADLSEISDRPGDELPQRVILLPQPADDELASLQGRPALERKYLQRLFHACVHLKLDEVIANDPDRMERLAARREQIGDVEFAEIREVLLKENYLFRPPTDVETYIEFMALALEFKYFAPSKLPLYFPAIRDWQPIEALFQQDLDHQALYERLKLSDSIDPEDAAQNETPSFHAASASTSKPHSSSLTKLRNLQSGALKQSSVGNTIKSALTHLRAAQAATGEQRQAAEAAAQAELGHFTERLQHALGLSEDEAEQWDIALQPLLIPANDGFWSNEARLLYDLQKVCIEQERGVHRLDLIGWIRTCGKQPIQRPLPLMQDAMTLRYLRTVRRRIGIARIMTSERQHLLDLLEGVFPQVESRFRDRLRKIINDVFDETGFLPKNVVESVARDKLVEELLDRIVDTSYLTIGNLRDAISKNDLKLEDVKSLSELVHGDCLLRADKRLDTALDGIYRRGAIYLRWPQTISSLMFGTNVGRWATQYLFVPFGGAYLLIEFLKHTVAAFSGHKEPHEMLSPFTGEMLDLPDELESAAEGDEQSTVTIEGESNEVTPRETGQGSDTEGAIDLPLDSAAASVPDADGPEVDIEAMNHLDLANAFADSSGGSDSWFWGSVLLLGTWLLLVMHRADFRAWNVQLFRWMWRFAKQIFFDLPSQIINSSFVQKILASRPFAVLWNYGLEPGLVVGMIYLFCWTAYGPLSLRTTIEIFLVLALFLNSTVGKFVSEWIVDFLVRAWHDLKIHVFSAVVQWIVDVFDWLFYALERIVYTVDEWLRFRAGENQVTRGFKLASGVVWFFVSYVIVFVFTLLIEPQINPLKHFPVVTVSHKMILPTGPILASKLAPYLGKAEAQALVWTTIWLIPGVFGFLVWELKENWRLYSANRRKRLGAEQIGHHGETMLRLLRPGFHSGTLPKAFGSLRRFMRKGGRREARRVQGKRAMIHHAEEAVVHFIERQLIALLEKTHFLPAVKLSAWPARVATNRIDIELLRGDQPEEPAVLTWEYVDSQLIGSIHDMGWIASLGQEDLEQLKTGLEGLFQRTGVDRIDGPLELKAKPTREWDREVEYWTGEEMVDS